MDVVGGTAAAARLGDEQGRIDGYKCEILGNCGSAVAQLGLKYVHNDTCYPALLVIGQFLDDGTG